MVAPFLKSVSPTNGTTVDPSNVVLELNFSQPIDTTNAKQASIALYDVSNEATPVWKAVVTAEHPSNATTTIRFDDLPDLIPNHHYCLRWDAGWIQVGGKPLGQLNDGAFWWRFRTR